MRSKSAQFGAHRVLLVDPRKSGDWKKQLYGGSVFSAREVGCFVFHLTRSTCVSDLNWPVDVIAHCLHSTGTTSVFGITPRDGLEMAALAWIDESREHSDSIVGRIEPSAKSIQKLLHSIQTKKVYLYELNIASTADPSTVLNLPGMAHPHFATFIAEWSRLGALLHVNFDQPEILFVCRYFEGDSGLIDQLCGFYS